MKNNGRKSKDESRRQKKCDTIVKAVVSQCGHKKCHSGRYSNVKLRCKKLNDWLIHHNHMKITPSSLLPNQKFVTVCYNLNRMIEKASIRTAANMVDSFQPSTTSSTNEDKETTKGT